MKATLTNRAKPLSSSGTDGRMCYHIEIDI